MIEELLSFTKKVGFFLRKQKGVAKNLGCKNNAVSSLVTEADIKVSQMFASFIKKHFSDLNYIIIDEETIATCKDNIFMLAQNSDYQFVIDPIDGTVQFASGHSLYGTTIGVYKKGKPLMGIIYLPELKELLYCDEKAAYLVQDAFTKKAIKTKLKKQKKSNSSFIFGESEFWHITKDFSKKEAVVVDYYSAVSQALYTLTGRAKAYCMFLHLWDIAGALPIAEKVGMKVFEYETRQIYNKISSSYFGEEMRTKKPCILCYPDDLRDIQKMIRPL